jgi:Spy/CpxP family protein refolding chaperone
MNKTLITLSTLLALSGSIPAAMAQPGFGPGMRGGPDAEYMALVLDLTPDQQAKLKTLYAEQAERRAQMRAAMQTEMQSKLQGILTKEQYAKMTELRTLRKGLGARGRGPGKGHGHGCAGWGPAAAPDPATAPSPAPAPAPAPSDAQ